MAGFAGTGASRVLTWCPTCNIQLSEIVMPSTKLTFALQHVIPYIAARIELLRPQFIHPVHKRVALHEHPGVAGVTEGVTQILTAIPGVELVDLGQPRVGYMCNSLAPVPAYKRNYMRGSSTRRPPRVSTVSSAFIMLAIASSALTKRHRRSRSSTFSSWWEKPWAWKVRISSSSGK